MFGFGINETQYVVNPNYDIISDSQIVPDLEPPKNRGESFHRNSITIEVDEGPVSNFNFKIKMPSQNVNIINNYTSNVINNFGPEINKTN